MTDAKTEATRPYRCSSSQEDMRANERAFVCEGLVRDAERLMAGGLGPVGVAAYTWGLYTQASRSLHHYPEGTNERSLALGSLDALARAVKVVGKAIEDYDGDLAEEAAAEAVLTALRELAATAGESAAPVVHLPQPIAAFVGQRPFSA